MATINQLSAVDSLQGGDQIPVYDSSNGDARKSSLTTLASWLEANLPGVDFTSRVVAPAIDGFNVDVGETTQNTWIIINPTAQFTTGSLSLPSGSVSVNNQEVMIVCTNQVNAFAVSSVGATVQGAPTELVEYTAFSFKYNASQNTWYMLDSTGTGAGGNTIINRFDFTGDGATTAYSLPGVPTALGESVLPFIDGIAQEQSAFSVSSNTVTFSAAPPLNSAIEIVVFDVADIGATTANLVSFIASGVGATARTSQNKMRDIVSVKDFGATGDGVTDDTAAIQTAIDSGHTVLYFPENSTFLTNGLTAVSNQTWTGGGKIVLKPTANSQQVLDAQNTTNFVIDDVIIDMTDSAFEDTQYVIASFAENFQVRNCLILGDLENKKQNAAFQVGQANGVIFSGNYFKNLSTNILRLTACSNLNLSNNIFRGQKARDPVYSVFPGRAMLLGASQYVSIVNNTFDGEADSDAVNLYDGVAAIDVGGCDYVTITGNTIRSYVNGINLEASGGNPSSDIVVSDNVLIGVLDNSTSEYVNRGIWVSAGGLTTPIIANNTISNYRIGLTPKQRAIVTGNKLLNIQEVGISAQGLIGMTISSNRLENCGISSASIDNLYFPIYVSSNSSGGSAGSQAIIISDNIIDDTPNAYSIVVEQIQDGGGFGYFYRIHGNYTDKALSIDPVADGLLSPDGNTRGNRMAISDNEFGLRSGMGGGFPIKLQAATATPDVTGLNIASTNNSGNTTITSLVGGADGQRLRIVFNDSVDGRTRFDFRLATGGNLRGFGGKILRAKNGDALDCVFDGANWQCSYIQTGDESTFSYTDDTTPYVGLYQRIEINSTAPRNLNSLDDGIVGQEVWVVFNDANTTVTFSTSANLRGNGGVNYNAPAQSAMLCKYDGTYWYCLV